MRNKISNITFFLALIIFLLLASPVFSAEEDLDGEIIGPYYITPKPLVSKGITIGAIIKNTGNNLATFSLKFYVIKDGIIKHSATFSFELYPEGTQESSTLFIPDDIGTYEILTKLMDGYENKTYDTKIGELKVTSEFGPFDLYIDLLTRKVNPGEELPLVVTIANKGETGTDVKVKLDISCYNFPYNISDEFTLYVGAKQQKQRALDLSVCYLANETGLHQLFAYAIVDEKILTTAKSNFLINETYFRLILEDIPEIFGIERGESKTFVINIGNPSNITIHNIGLLVEKIPYEWVDIEPLKITKIESNKSGIFFVKLTIPQDVEIGEYPITILAASDETSSREMSRLTVLKAGVPSLWKPEYLTIIYLLIGITIFGICSGIILLYQREKVRKKEMVWIKLKKKWSKGKKS